MFRALIRSMRPRQWTKNIFLFTALVFDRKLTHYPALLHTVLGAVCFSLLASAIYIANDIMDIEMDRQHPEKKKRPIPSGEISIPAAWISAALLAAAGLIGAGLLSLSFLGISLLYLVLNLLYSKWLKHIAILDVLVLASFYVLRVTGGVVLVLVDRFSPWLYVVTTLFALFIGFGKRRAELNLMSEDARHHRRVLGGYSIQLLDQLITIVSSTTIVSYSLYTFSAPNLPDNNIMMLTIPFVLYGVFRYLYLLHIGQGGAPEEIALQDRPLQASIVLWGVSILLIFYLF
jgi:4-hydroxybenzoate polyprenyltransferase